MILKSGPEIKNRCSLWAVSGENLASIRKCGPEIKSRCTQEGVNRENLAAIPKSRLEIKNQCTKEGVNRENLAAIPKSRPEIKNRCSRGLVALCRRNRSSSRQRRIESDAEGRCGDGCCRRNHSHCRIGDSAAIPKFTPRNQESLHAKGRKRANPCSDSQVYPLKSRITARWRA